VFCFRHTLPPACFLLTQQHRPYASSERCFTIIFMLRLLLAPHAASILLPLPVCDDV